MRIFYARPGEGGTSLPDYFGGMEAKQRAKLYRKLGLLATGSLSGPDVKHFSIAKYSRLYELQIRGKTTVRLIFAPTRARGGDIILLVPFIKRHKRHTMQALETAIALLDGLNSGEYVQEELKFNDNLEVTQ